MMKQLRMKTLALACALLTAISAAPQPAHAASGDIADLINRAANVTAAVQEEAAVQQAAPAEDAVHEVVSAEPEFTKGVIIGGTINVRTGPSTNCERITQVTTGKFVTVLGTDNGWYQIQFDSTTGYVLGDYLREATDADSTIGEQLVNMALPGIFTVSSATPCPTARPASITTTAPTLPRRICKRAISSFSPTPPMPSGMSLFISATVRSFTHATASAE